MKITRARVYNVANLFKARMLLMFGLTTFLGEGSVLNSSAIAQLFLLVAMKEGKELG